MKKTNLLACTALAFALAGAPAVLAATDANSVNTNSTSANTGSSSAVSSTGAKRYSEMTQQDCASLPYNKSNYSTTEFNDRTTYCNQTFKGTASNVTPENFNSSTSNTAATTSKKSSNY